MTFAALAAVAWGVSDFLAGLLARRIPVLTILIGSKVAAMLLAVVVVAARGVPPPDDSRLWLGVVAGLIGFPAMGLLYRAMRDGSLVVVAPVAAVAALVPVGWGLLHGERLGMVAALGVVIGLIGVTMASWPVASQRRPPRSAQACALGAAIGLGVYFVLLHEAAAADQIWSTALARMTGGSLALLFLITVRRLPRPPRDVVEPIRQSTGKTACPQVGLRPQPALRLLPKSPSARTGLAIAVPVSLVGATDALADASFILAASAALAPAAVVASLYPAVTLLLNRSLLRERLHTVHLYGVLAALFAVACLAR